MIESRRNKLHFFVDASVIFAMSYSSRGASRELCSLALSKKIILTTSTYAIDEAICRIQQDYPSILISLKQILTSHTFRMTEASEQDVATALSVVSDPYDSPIIAAAKNSRCDALVSFDRKHLHTLEVEQYIGSPVVTPGTALTIIRSL